jgi:hypothetical protein
MESFVKFKGVKNAKRIGGKRMSNFDGSVPSECFVCNCKSILRYNVCKECDDAFWLTRMSKKQHGGCENHSIYDVKYIKHQMKKRSDKINELKAENEKLETRNKNLLEVHEYTKANNKRLKAKNKKLRELLNKADRVIDDTVSYLQVNDDPDDIIIEMCKKYLKELEGK